MEQSLDYSLDSAYMPTLRSLGGDLLNEQRLDYLFDPAYMPTLRSLGCDLCRCQNRRISGRGSRTVRLRRMVTGGGGHNIYPGSGPLDGGNTLLPA